MQTADESWHLKHKGRKGHIILTFQAKLGTLSYAIGGVIALLHVLTNLRLQYPTLDAHGYNYYHWINMVLFTTNFCSEIFNL